MQLKENLKNFNTLCAENYIKVRKSMINALKFYFRKIVEMVNYKLIYTIHKINKTGTTKLCVI